MARSSGPTLTTVRSALKKGGHPWKREPFELNVVGVRSSKNTPGQFGDWLTCSWLDDGGMWFFRRWRCSTDPWSFWRNHPLNSGAGRGILPAGHHGALWALGTVRGRHPGLVQVSDVEMWTDEKKRTKATHSLSGPGRFGVACHWQEDRPFRWHPGCQVFEHEHQFGEFLAIVRHSLQVIPGVIDYTLIMEGRKQ